MEKEKVARLQRVARVRPTKARVDELERVEGVEEERAATCQHTEQPIPSVSGYGMGLDGRLAWDWSREQQGKEQKLFGLCLGPHDGAGLEDVEREGVEEVEQERAATRQHTEQPRPRVPGQGMGLVD